MVSFASFGATLGFLFPVLAFLLVRARRDRELWEVGLDIPIAVSIDLLVVLALSRLMPLGIATLASRAAYLGGATALLVTRHRRGLPAPAWPATIGRRELLLLTTATVVAVLLSTEISSAYSIWDRRWHIPLVASLRGQSIPFRNVFDGRQGLHYHFSGDVHAAMLQALSGGVLHAALALSLAHDIHFGLIGLTLGLFLASWGYRRKGAFALAAMALILGGPLTLFRDGDRSAQQGYSVINFLSISFRPHVSLAGLLMMGFVGAAIARLRAREDLDWRKTAPALCLCAAALAICDEASLGLLGLSLGLTWLLAPQVIHPSRKVGLLVFGALLVALVLPNVLYAATLGSGGQKHVFSLAPWRSPGCYTPTLPLTDPKGRTMLLYDVLPPVVIGVGVLLCAVARRGRPRRDLAIFLLILLVSSLLTLTRVDVDKSPLEMHRFMTALFVVAPLIGLVLLAPESGAASAARAAPYGAIAIGLGMVLGSLSTWDWERNILPKRGDKHDHFFASIDHYATNCRTEVGETLGARARLTYLAKPIWYLYAGCHPVIAPGAASGDRWELTIGNPLFEKEAIAAIRKELPAGASIPAICPAAGSSGDAICNLVAKNGSCHPIGPRMRECELSAAEAATFAP